MVSIRLGRGGQTPNRSDYSVVMLSVGHATPQGHCNRVRPADYDDHDHDDHDDHDHDLGQDNSETRKSTRPPGHCNRVRLAMYIVVLNFFHKHCKT